MITESSEPDPNALSSTPEQPAPRRGPSNVKSAMTIRRIQALFDAMAGDHLFREQFVTDPAQIYAEYVHREPLDRHRADVINQFVYAVLANDDLLQWVIDYRNERQGVAPSDAEFATRFTKAVVDHNAHHAAVAMTRAANERQPIFPLDPAITDLLFGGGGGISGLTSFQTFRVTDEAFGTEVSTGTQTEISTGTETTEISTPPPPPPPPEPPMVIVNFMPIVNFHPLGTAHRDDLFGDGSSQVVIDTMRAFAAELRDRGALDDVGLG